MFYPNGAVEDKKRDVPMWAIGGMVGAKCCFICDMNQGSTWVRLGTSVCCVEWT